MTEEELAGDDSGATRSRAFVKRGVPRGSLEEAEALAAHLWEVARRGSVPPIVFAKQIGYSKPSGGAWHAKLALMRVFGLLTEENGNFKLSDLAYRLVNKGDKAGQLPARRDAILAVKSYAELLNNYNGASLPTIASIEGRFEYDYSLADRDAKEAAQNFVKSIGRAGFLDGETVRLSGSEGNSTAAPDALHVARDDEDSGEVPSKPGSDVGGFKGPSIEPAPRRDAVPPSMQGGLGTVSLQLSLDLSSFEPADVLEILGALGFTRSQDD